MATKKRASSAQTDSDIPITFDEALLRSDDGVPRTSDVRPRRHQPSGVSARATSDRVMDAPPSLEAEVVGSSLRSIARAHFPDREIPGADEDDEDDEDAFEAIEAKSEDNRSTAPPPMQKASTPKQSGRVAKQKPINVVEKVVYNRKRDWRVDEE
jgi:hypothetical protein